MNVKDSIGRVGDAVRWRMEYCFNTYEALDSMPCHKEQTNK